MGIGDVNSLRFRVSERLKNRFPNLGKSFYLEKTDECNHE